MPTPNYKALIRAIYDFGSTTDFIVQVDAYDPGTIVANGQPIVTAWADITFTGGYTKSDACRVAAQTQVATLLNTFTVPLPDAALVAGDVSFNEMDFAGATQVFGSSKLVNPAIVSRSTTVSSGVATFDLTDANGNAIFSSVAIPGGVKISVDEKEIVAPSEIAALSVDKKTLTVDVRKLVISLGIISLSTNADNGTKVSALVVGEKA